METKRAKVIMLPTKGPIYWTADEKLTIDSSDRRIGFISNNLYFTADEEIKEGDWFYNNRSNRVHQCIKYYNENVIATNDEDYDVCNVEFSFKIIATTDKSLYQYAMHSEGKVKIDLPQPSQAFIEKYCKLGGIDEVDVEYTCNKCKGTKEIDTGMGILECKHCYYKHNSEYPDLKTDSHNTITIHPIKDSWNKEELIELCKKAFKDGQLSETNYMEELDFQDEDQWVKENI